MKLHALMIAVALAAGSALAATPAAGTGADAATTPPAMAADTTVAPVKKNHQNAAAKKKHDGTRVGMGHGTQAMGAGGEWPMTDLQAASRQARIDQAYANWQAAQR